MELNTYCFLEVYAKVKKKIKKMKTVGSKTKRKIRKIVKERKMKINVLKIQEKGVFKNEKNKKIGGRQSNSVN